MCGDRIAGAMVARGGATALWARTIAKADRKALTLRDEQGLRVWKLEVRWIRTAAGSRTWSCDNEPGARQRVS